MHESREKKGKTAAYSTKGQKFDTSVSLGAMGNKHCGQYLTGMDTYMTDMQRVKLHEKHTAMKTVSSYNGSSGNSPEGVADIEMETGDIEVGVDAKSRESVLSFVHNTGFATGRRVVENNSFALRAHDNERVRSNDGYFDEGAMSLRCSVDKNSDRIDNQLNFISREGRHTTVDKVAPFKSIKPESDRLYQLRELKSATNTDRTYIHTGISAVNTLISRKKQNNLKFTQKLNEIISDNKVMIRKVDEYLLFRRKRLMQQDEEEELVIDSTL